jgi:hypothetical protein
VGAEATAKELPRLGLADALELKLLIARKDPRRHPSSAWTWQLRVQPRLLVKPPQQYEYAR